MTAYIIVFTATVGGANTGLHPARPLGDRVFLGASNATAVAIEAVLDDSDLCHIVVNFASDHISFCS